MSELTTLSRSPSTQDLQELWSELALTLNFFDGFFSRQFVLDFIVRVRTAIAAGEQEVNDERCTVQCYYYVIRIEIHFFIIILRDLWGLINSLQVVKKEKKYHVVCWIKLVTIVRCNKASGLDFYKQFLGWWCFKWYTWSNIPNHWIYNRLKYSFFM